MSRKRKNKSKKQMRHEEYLKEKSMFPRCPIVPYGVGKDYNPYKEGKSNHHFSRPSRMLSEDLKAFKENSRILSPQELSGKNTSSEFDMGDKQIKCIDCHKDFIFTESEQQFFEEKAYSEPIRCKDCRSKKSQKETSGFR